ncbi:MAG: hypothetical protein ACOC4F_04425, partial [bacterium]
AQRAAADMYKLYMFWALVVVGISVLVRTVLWIFVEEMQALEATPLTLFRGPGRIFMLVTGIVTGVYAIAYFIRQGVTRRSFLVGGVVAGVAIAVSLQIVGFVLYGLTAVLGPLLPIDLHMSGLPHAGTTGLALGITIDVLLITAYFFMGWIIGFAFCRFKFGGGMLAVFTALFVLGSLTSLWGEDVEIFVTGIRIPPIDGLPVSLSLIITLTLLGVQLTTLFLMLRNAPLKVQ